MLSRLFFRPAIQRTFPHLLPISMFRFATHSIPEIKEKSIDQIMEDITDAIEAGNSPQNHNIILAYMKRVEEISNQETEGLPFDELGINARAWLSENQPLVEVINKYLKRNVISLSSNNLISYLQIVSGVTSTFAYNNGILLNEEQLYSLEQQLNKRFSKYYDQGLTLAIMAFAKAQYLPYLLLGKFPEDKKLTRLSKDDCLNLLIAANFLSSQRKQFKPELLNDILFQVRKTYVIQMQPKLAMATLKQMVPLNTTGPYRIFGSEQLKENLVTSIVTLIQLLNDFHQSLTHEQKYSFRAKIDPELACNLAEFIVPPSLNIQKKQKFASILVNVTNDHFQVNNLKENIRTLSTLLALNPDLIKPHLNFKLYSMCVQNPQVISKMLSFSEMSQIVQILTHQYLKQRKNFELLPFLKYTTDYIQNVGTKHLSIDDCVALLYAFCKCGLIDYQTAPTSPLYHACIALINIQPLKPQSIVPLLWSLCFLQHLQADMPNPYLASLYYDCQNVQFKSINIVPLKQMMIDFYEIYSYLKLLSQQKKFPKGLLDTADMEILAFSKTFYRRKQSELHNSENKTTVEEIGSLLNRCRVGYRKNHWVNGDIHLDVKVKGSNVRLELLQSGVIIRDENQFNEKNSLVGSELMKNKFYDMKNYSLLSINEGNWSKTKPEQKEVMIESFLAKATSKA